MATLNEIFNKPTDETAANYGQKSLDSIFGVQSSEDTSKVSYGQDMLSDVKQTGTEILNTVKNAGSTIADAQRMSMSGEQSPIESGFQMAGAVLGGASNVLGSVVKGGVKAVLPQSGEDALKQGIATGVQAASDLTNKYEELKTTKPILAKTISFALGGTPDAVLSVKDMISGYQRLQETNPRAARNVDAALGIGQFIADFATLGGSKVAGTATKEAITTGAEQVGKQVGKVAGKVSNVAGDIAMQTGSITKGARKVVADIVPTKSEFMSGQISKALDLTQGDLSNIKLATGNDVGDFIARNNLIGGSKKETIDAVKKLTDSQYKLVRDEIAKVPNVYSVNDIPKVKQSLSLLEKQVKGVPGLEDTYKQVKALSKKTSIELKDVQKVKELLDDQFSLFKATGDVKEGTIKKGLANVRKNIKEFIETEVKNTTGADIAQLNNDVSTGKSIMNLANKRSTREFTRANVSLSDLGAFGGGSMIGTPLFGAAAVAVKRIAETPTARLYLAKLINSLPKATQKAVQEELLSGSVPKVIKDTISDYRLATNIKKSSTTSAKKASIPKVSTLSKTKASKLSTDLISEAKKYKSADEFVKAQGETVYRGGKELSDKNITDAGVSVASHKKIAEDFVKQKGGTVSEYKIRPEAKIVDFQDVPNVKFKNLNDYSPELDTGDKQIWRDLEVEYQKAINWAKQNGYDAVKLPLEREVRVINPDVLKTKSQLTDIWNKANNGQLNPLLEEAKKYKSAETPLIKFAKRYKSIAALESDLPRFDSLSNLAKNVRALNINQFPRLKGEELVTVYRGAHPNSKSITAGDWITLDKSTARNYSSNIQELKIKKSDIVNPGIETDEYIFAPKSIESTIEILLQKANKK